jgi:hypothetical protein
VKVVQLAVGDVEPVVSEGYGFLPWHDLVECVLLGRRLL